MKTENEIVAAVLEEVQKLWVELKTVTTTDKDFASARAIIELIEARDDWEEPKQTPAVAKDNVIVDGKAVKKGETIGVFSWQYNALRRFLTSAEELAKAATKKAGKGAAVLLLGLLLGLGFSASAQVQSYVYGTSGQYNVQPVAGLNGGTNAWQGTNATFATTILTTNLAVTPNWTFVNGIWNNAPATNITSIVASTPGLVSVVNYDSFDIAQGGNLLGAGANTLISSWDTTRDFINWHTNAFQLATVLSGTAPQASDTNIVQVQYGGVRLNTAWVTNTGTGGTLTNAWVEITKKSNRQGP